MCSFEFLPTNKPKRKKDTPPYIGDAAVDAVGEDGAPATPILNAQPFEMNVACVDCVDERARVQRKHGIQREGASGSGAAPVAAASGRCNGVAGASVGGYLEECVASLQCLHVSVK